MGRKARGGDDVVPVWHPILAEEIEASRRDWRLKLFTIYAGLAVLGSLGNFAFERATDLTARGVSIVPPLALPLLLAGGLGLFLNLRSNDEASHQRRWQHWPTIASTSPLVLGAFLGSCGIVGFMASLDEWLPATDFSVVLLIRLVVLALVVAPYGWFIRIAYRAQAGKSVGGRSDRPPALAALRFIGGSVLGIPAALLAVQQPLDLGSLIPWLSLFAAMSLGLFGAYIVVGAMARKSDTTLAALLSLRARAIQEGLSTATVMAEIHGYWQDGASWVKQQHRPSGLDGPTLHASDLAERAFELVKWDRLKRRDFCDWIDQWNAEAHRDEICASVTDILAGRTTFVPDEAHFYQWPKGPLTWRRMIHLSFHDAVLRYALVLLIQDDARALQPTCFANRRNTGPGSARHLLRPYPEAMRSWRAWQERELAGRGAQARAAVTDLSAFYDTIGHDELVRTVQQSTGWKASDRRLLLLRQALDPPLVSEIPAGTTCRSLVHQGLATGNESDAMLANWYMQSIDDAMVGNGVAYARYCDDVNIIGDDEDQVRLALRKFMVRIQVKALAINTRKTDLKTTPDAIKKMLAKQATSSYYYETVPLPGEDDDDFEPMDLAAAFDSFTTTFDATDATAVHEDPVGYCKFVSQQSTDGSRLLRDKQRDAVHVERLAEIAATGGRGWKWATWLVVQSATWSRFPRPTRTTARRLMVLAIADADLPMVTWIRYVHHLLVPRSPRAYLASLADEDLAAIRAAALARSTHSEWPVRRTAEAVLQEIDAALAQRPTPADP